MNDLVRIASAFPLPTLIVTAGDQATRRFLEFFAANIRNPHTRRAYSRAVADFMAWCSAYGVPSVAAVQPLHVATWIEMQTRELSAATVKQRLAAIRHRFDWLVTGQVIPVNPAASVRGPAHVTRTGKTPVLEPAEARALIDSIDITTPVGLRDRALIGQISNRTVRREQQTLPTSRFLNSVAFQATVSHDLNPADRASATIRETVGSLTL